jgi:hypothetical protein
MASWWPALVVSGSCRIEADLSDLSYEDQDLINEAVTVIRTTRQTVHLGFPAIRPPATDGSADAAR